MTEPDHGSPLAVLPPGHLLKTLNREHGQILRIIDHMEQANQLLQDGDSERALECRFYILHLVRLQNRELRRHVVALGVSDTR